MDRRVSSPVKRLQRRSFLKSPNLLNRLSDNSNFSTPKMNSDLDKSGTRLSSGKKKLRRSRVYNVVGDSAHELRKILAERRHSLDQVDEGSENDRSRSANNSVCSVSTPSAAVSPKTVPGGISSLKEKFIPKHSPTSDVGDDSIESPPKERRKSCRRLSSSKLNPFGRRTAAYLRRRSSNSKELQKKAAAEALKNSEHHLHEGGQSPSSSSSPRNSTLLDIIKKSTPSKSPGGSKARRSSRVRLSDVKANVSNLMSPLVDQPDHNISESTNSESSVTRSSVATKSPRKRKSSYTPKFTPAKCSTPVVLPTHKEQDGSPLLASETSGYSSQSADQDGESPIEAKILRVIDTLSDVKSPIVELEVGESSPTAGESGATVGAVVRGASISDKGNYAESPSTFLSSFKLSENTKNTSRRSSKFGKETHQKKDEENTQEPATSSDTFQDGAKFENSKFDPLKITTRSKTKQRRQSGTVSSKASPRRRSGVNLTPNSPAKSNVVKKVESFRSVPGGIAKLMSMFDKSSPGRRRSSKRNKEKDDVKASNIENIDHINSPVNSPVNSPKVCADKLGKQSSRDLTSVTSDYRNLDKEVNTQVGEKCEGVNVGKHTKDRETNVTRDSQVSSVHGVSHNFSDVDCGDFDLSHSLDLKNINTSRLGRKSARNASQVSQIASDVDSRFRTSSMNKSTEKHDDHLQKHVSFGLAVFHDYRGDSSQSNGSAGLRDDNLSASPNRSVKKSRSLRSKASISTMDHSDSEKAFDAVIDNVDNDSVEAFEGSTTNELDKSARSHERSQERFKDSRNESNDFDTPNQSANLSGDLSACSDGTPIDLKAKVNAVTFDLTPRSSVLADPSALLREKFARNLEMNFHDEYNEEMESEQDEETPESSRYHSQPIDPSQIPRSKENGESQKEEKPAKSTSGGGHVRHKTQPITDSEKQKAESQPASVRGSIHERLAKLKQHGEEDWKKRVRGKDRDIGNIDLSTVKLRDKSKLKSQQQPPAEQQRPKSIADRLSKLENSQASWKERVEEKDVSQFTVEGKLNRSGKTTTPDSPLLARRKKMRAPLTRANSSPLLPLDSSETVSSEMEERPVTKIEVPEPYDEDFQSFFGTQDVTSSEAIDVTVDDFDHIFMESEDMLPSTKKIRPQRKQRTTKNPLKTLAARDDVQSEYTEVRTDIADKELRRIKREQISGSAGFAEEALAGLAHKADFSKVNLRKTDSFGSSTPAGTSGKYEPFKDVMLLHVKGRRHCQVRLVEPTSASLNSGDSFVLVTSDKVYVWIGEYCNIIEKSKATDVAATIQQKRDLGCKSYLEPIVIYEKRQDSPHSKGFWEAIGGKDEYQGPGPVEEDELYEMYMTETNKVWVLDPGAEKLVELDDYRGTVLPYALLNTKAALVFDFGSEFYIWTGKQVPFVTRKMALKLAREQFESGYDYSKFDINPFSPLSTPENGGLPLQAEERPEWALFGKVNENMETILFREKFADWPDSSRLIKVKTDSDDQKTDTPPELEPYDATKMIIVKNTPVDLLLEGSHIGRGQKWVDKTEGITREFEILTLSCQVWHILEYDHSEVEEDSFGQFHDGDTYVVRWHFMVSQAGRTLKGQEARHSVTGRERCAYFFWQGRNSSINEKGASALMTVELDEERGPQVRVIQGKEPPYFIQLFKGRMVTHLGKREDESTNSQGPFRMYIVRNELPREAYLAEITCNISNLRSRGAFLLINVKTGVCYLWIGCKSSAQTRGRARELANNLVNNCPLELGLHPKASVTIKETEEGKENSEFWSALDSSHRSLYFSLLKVPKPCQFTMRLFTMTSVSGIFEASELLNPCRSEEVASPFPFIQSDLYKLDQPSLVMVDAGPEVWVWHGWWPEGTEDSENIKTGSAHARFNTERKLALQTTISYCTEKFGSSGAKDRAFATYAGLEPLSFTNLFPHWSIQNDVTDIQLKEGRHVGERRKIDDLLVQLNRNNYAWSELQQRPLPEGVDPLRLESYLNDDEFLEMLGMSKEEFYKLPPWKQGNLKKTVGLF